MGGHVLARHTVAAGCEGPTDYDCDHNDLLYVYEDAPGKPLQKERWAGVVDAVGSQTLANACAQTRYGGAVAACGLAQGMDFPATVAPFILRGISFYSTCEHHLLPFYGQAVVGYLPGKVVGISKLARLVECFAKRLQVQERMTRQIAEAVETHLEARGVGVVLRAHHLCMGCRGVRQEETEMVTSSMLGTLRTDATSRAEFLKLCRQS